MNVSDVTRIGVRSLCIVGVIAAGGCADTHPVEVAPAHPSAAHPPAVAGPSVPDTEAGVKPGRPPGRRPPADATQSAAIATPVPADLAAQPVKLIGLTEPETVALLGAPSAQWDRPPAKVWRYQGPDCSVDVFFYLDVSRNEFSALRTTAAGADGTVASNGQQCLSRIHDVAQRK